MEEMLVKMRKMQLIGFMQTIIAHPYLYSSEEYQQFIRGGGDYERCAAAVTPATSRRILFRYERFFGQPVSEDEDNLNSQIKQFEGDFKWQLEALREIKRKTKDLMESYDLFQRNLLAFADGVKDLEPILRQNDDEMPWFEPPARVKEFDNPYLYIHSWFVMEKQECSAMYNAIKARNGIFNRRQIAISEKEKCEQKFKRLCQGKMLLPWQSRNQQKVKYEERIDTVRK
jgi:hypothetical protein